MQKGTIMRNAIKRTLAAILAVSLALLFPLAAIAEEVPPLFFEETHMTLALQTDQTVIQRGGIVNVNVRITENTGFREIAISPVLDDGLSLAGDPVNGGIATASGDGYSFTFGSNQTATGTLVTIPVLVAENAPTGPLTVDLRVERLVDKDGYALDGSWYPYCLTIVPLDLDPTIHTHSYTATTIPATCTEPGRTTYTCECGDTYVDETPALGHNFVYSSTVTAATCTTDGLVKRYCSNCMKYVEEVVPAAGHDYSTTVVEATCTTGGSVTYVCSVCGDTYVDETPALGHNFVYSFTVTAATCTTDGLVKRYCSNCTQYVEEMISATGHTWGEATYVWSDNNAACTATRTCTVCGETETETVNSTSEVTLAPTATVGGMITYTCTFTNPVFQIQTATVETEPTGGSVSPDEPQIVVESKTVAAGTTFTLNVSIVNNPGFMLLTLKPAMDSGLVLESVEKGDMINALTSGTVKYILDTGAEDATEDGVLLTLTVSTAADLEPGDYLLSFDALDCSDSGENELDLPVVAGVITVTEPQTFLWGDANGDGVVSNKDIVRLKNYFANYDGDTGLSTVILGPAS